MNEQPALALNCDGEQSACEKNGVKGCMNQQIQIVVTAPVVKSEMTNKQTDTERDFKKASRLNRKRRLAALGRKS